MFPYCNLYSRGNDQAMAVGGCRSRYNDLGLLSIRNLKLSRVSLSILRSQGTYTRQPKQNQKYQGSRAIDPPFWQITSSIVFSNQVWFNTMMISFFGFNFELDK